MLLNPTPSKQTVHITCIRESAKLHLGSLHPNYIYSFCELLFPIIDHSIEPLEMFVVAISRFVKVMIGKGTQCRDVIAQIQKQADKLGENLGNRVSQLLKEPRFVYSVFQYTDNTYKVPQIYLGGVSITGQQQEQKTQYNMDQEQCVVVQQQCQEQESQNQRQDNGQRFQQMLQKLKNQKKAEVQKQQAEKNIKEKDKNNKNLNSANQESEANNRILSNANDFKVNADDNGKSKIKNKNDLNPYADVYQTVSDDSSSPLDQALNFANIKPSARNQSNSSFTKNHTNFSKINGNSKLIGKKYGASKRDQILSKYPDPFYSGTPAISSGFQSGTELASKFVAVGRGGPSAILSEKIKNYTNTSTCTCGIPCQQIFQGPYFPEDLQPQQSQTKSKNEKKFPNKDSFRCTKCENVFHKKCMGKGVSSALPTKRNATTSQKHCLFCHLRLIQPDKVVHRQLFSCILHKKRKRHEIMLDLTKRDLQLMKNDKFALQLRCFRLSPKTKNFILFPDSASIYFNNKQVKQFKPLNKISSLKYRKDEPFSLGRIFPDSKYKITIIEKDILASSQDRIEQQFHLLGVYLVENMSINQTISKFLKQSLPNPQYSRNLLRQQFMLGSSKSSKSVSDDSDTKIKSQNGQQNKGKSDLISQSDSQQLKMQILKIPLTCSLTTQNLKYPVRGIFCTHFQCLDLKNYLMMIGTAVNPRWICPICKEPCYEFKMDQILCQIINNPQIDGKKRGQMRQVMFHQSGNYQIIDRLNKVLFPIRARLGSSQKQHKNQEQHRNEQQIKFPNIFDEMERLQKVLSLKRAQPEVSQHIQAKQQQAQQAQQSNSNGTQKGPRKKRKLQLPPEEDIIVLSD